MNYLVIIQRTDTGFAAYAPDMEDCVARARTAEQAERQIRAVIEFHHAGMRRGGASPPAPSAYATYVNVME